MTEYRIIQRGQGHNARYKIQFKRFWWWVDVTEEHFPHDAFTPYVATQWYSNPQTALEYIQNRGGVGQVVFSTHIVDHG